MTNIGIQVILEAQTAQAANNVNNFSSDVTAMSNAVDQASRSINQDFRSINDAAAAAQGQVSSLNDVFRNMTAGTSTLNQSLATTNNVLTVNQRNTNALTNANRNLAGSMAGITRPTVNANGALAGFTNIIRDAPYGIVGVGNNITQLTDAFRQMQVQTGSTSRAIGALVSSLFSPAGLFTVGLSLAISLWTVYSQRQQRAASESKKAAEEIKSLADIQRDANKALSQYQADAYAEIAVLNQLFNIARSDVRSRQERTSALRELQQATNGYLRNLNLETIQTDSARAALDRYNQSLFDNAVAKAYQGQIDDIAKAYAAVKEKADQGRQTLEQFDKNVQAATANLAKLKAQGNPSADLVDSEKFAADNAAKRAKIVAETNGYIKQQNSLYDAIINKGKQLAEVQVKTNPFDKASNTAGAADKVKKIWDDLRNTLNAIDLEGDLIGKSFDQISTERIDALQLALKELAKAGFATTSPEILQIKKEIDDLSASILGGTKIYSNYAKQLAQPIVTMNVFNKDVIESQLATFFDESSPLKPEIYMKPTVVIIPDALNTPIATAQNQFNERLQRFKATTGIKINQFTKDLNDLIQSSAQDGIISLSDAVGAALGKGGGISDVLSAFVNMIADFGSKLGKQLIIQGLAIEAFKTSLSSLQGVVAIAAGAALIAASAAFRSLASQGVNSYATGGIVTSPQLALIGDNPGRKEAIIPSEMWDKIGGGGEFTATAKIKGSDLLIAVQRASREFNRYN